jgi:hypothetical protein
MGRWCLPRCPREPGLDRCALDGGMTRISLRRRLRSWRMGGGSWNGGPGPIMAASMEFEALDVGCILRRVRQQTRRWPSASATATPGNQTRAGDVNRSRKGTDAGDQPEGVEGVSRYTGLKQNTQPKRGRLRYLAAGLAATLYSQLCPRQRMLTRTGLRI